MFHATSSDIIHNILNGILDNIIFYSNEHIMLIFDDDMTMLL